eukprot:3160382-Rhodomonas_salina.1
MPPGPGLSGRPCHATRARGRDSPRAVRADTFPSPNLKVPSSADTPVSENINGRGRFLPLRLFLAKSYDPGSAQIVPVSESRTFSTGRRLWRLGCGAIAYGRELPTGISQPGPPLCYEVGHAE